MCIELFGVEGDDEGFGDDVGDEDGAEFYGARKKVKQERGQFQTKGKPKGGFSGSKVKRELVYRTIM